MSDEQIIFSGASDDLVHVAGPITTYDEVGARHLKDLNTDGATFVVTQPLDDRPGTASVRVTVALMSPSVWQVSAMQIDEDVPMPEGMTVGSSEVCAYSAQLTIPWREGTVIVREA